MLRVGLTGGIGSGKSTVSQYFAALGVPIIDADKIAKALLLEPEIKQALFEHFGEAIAGNDQQIDRMKLRKLIFSNPEAKKWLENLLHPKVRANMASLLQEMNSNYAILEIPLLVETLPNPLIDRILLVKSPLALKLERIIKRDNIPESLAREMIDQQLPDSEKEKVADDILLNDENLERLEERVLCLHKQYLDLASQG